MEQQSLQHTHTVSRPVENCDKQLRGRHRHVSADAPTVMSCSMPPMMRSHSSSRLLSPHSPTRGLYISSLISSGVTGIPPPSVSGCGAAHTQIHFISCLNTLLICFYLNMRQMLKGLAIISKRLHIPGTQLFCLSVVPSGKTVQLMLLKLKKQKNSYA